MYTCEVCYDDVEGKNMDGLSCNHIFCKACVKEHLTSLVRAGKAVTIRCMQHGCNERFTAEVVREYCDDELFKVFEAVNQEVLVGKSSKLKWCTTPDCMGILKRPGCCC